MTATALGSCGFHGSGTRRHTSDSSVQPAAVIGMPHSRNSSRFDAEPGDLYPAVRAVRLRCIRGIAVTRVVWQRTG
jgi:hypothetical protein